MKKGNILKQMGMQHVCGDCTIMQSQGKLKNHSCLLCGASYNSVGLLDFEITKKKIYLQFSEFGFHITPLEIEMVVTKALTSKFQVN